MKSLIGEIPIVLPSEGVVEYVAFRVIPELLPEGSTIPLLALQAFECTA